HAFGMLDGLYAAGHAPGDAPVIAFRAQHVDDPFGAVVAEELTAMLLVPGNAMAFDEVKEITRAIGRERGAAKVRIAGNELPGSGTDIGEVAAPTARNTNLLGQTRGMIDQHHPQAALPRHG